MRKQQKEKPVLVSTGFCYIGVGQSMTRTDITTVLTPTVSFTKVGGRHGNS